MPSEPPGQRILDVSTGIGEPAVTLSKRVGADGSILATDQSAGMLAVARERIVSEGLSNIELVQVDTEVLDMPENESDGAVCRWRLLGKFWIHSLHHLQPMHLTFFVGGAWGPSLSV